MTAQQLVDLGVEASMAAAAVGAGLMIASVIPSMVEARERIRRGLLVVGALLVLGVTPVVAFATFAYALSESDGPRGPGAEAPLRAGRGPR